MRVLTWNLEWVKLSWWRAAPILERLRSEAADIAVLTETQVPLAREVYQHITHVGPHPKARQPHGSKVVIASHHPIDPIDLVGSPDLPPHNFAAVDIQTPELGRVRVIGLVIRWKEKRQFVDALPEALRSTVNGTTVLAGDFNMSLLKYDKLEQDLRDTLAAVGLRVDTSGEHSTLADELPLIDHIAVGSELASRDLRVWGRHTSGDERPISDHAGASVAIDLVTEAKADG